jgi:hypothetical protein
MYLSTQYGFFSVVRADKTFYLVRAFSERDLHNLTSAAGIYSSDAIEEKPDSYYPYRRRLTADEFLLVIEWLAKRVDYEDFGDRIAQLPDQVDKLKSYRKLTDAVPKYGAAKETLPFEEQPSRASTNYSTSADGEPAPVTIRNIENVLYHFSRVERQIEPQKAIGIRDEDHCPPFTKAVREFMFCLFREGMLFEFDSMPWAEQLGDKANDPAFIAGVDLLTLRKLLVLCWRADYWDYDHTVWEHLALTGHLTMLMDRLQELRDELARAADQGDQ